MRRGNPVPHYDRHAGLKESAKSDSDSVLGDDEDAMQDAAQALREAEVEAVRPTKDVPDPKSARKDEHQ